MLVIYLGIMTLRARRTRRELSDLRGELAEKRAREELDGPRGGAVAGEGRPAERDREPAL
jgi:hypothetical protein